MTDRRRCRWRWLDEMVRNSEDPSDPWCLPHFYLPILIQIFLRNWLVSLLIVFAWETLEQLSRRVLGRYPFLQTRADDAPESAFNSIVVDPVLGACGIGVATYTAYALGVPHLRASVGGDGWLVLQMAIFVLIGSHSGTLIGWYVLAALGSVYWLPVLYVWNGSVNLWAYWVLLATHWYVLLAFMWQPLRVAGSEPNYAWNAIVAALLHVAVVSFVATFCTWA